MYLRITGESKKVSREEVRTAAYFYAERLMPLRLTNLLRVSIIFRPNLWREENATGKCTCWSSVAPRKFRICLEPKEPRIQILQTLAHEFIHLKQYASGEMRDYCFHERTKYRGKYFPFPETDDDEAYYWKSPWEKEAHSKEIGLWKRFLKYLDKQKEEI